MSLFGGIKAAFKAGSKEVQANYANNKDYLEAVCAAVALVANADGTIDDGEKAKALRIMREHKQLGTWYQPNVIEQTLETMLKRAATSSGRQSLAAELDDVKGRENSKQMCADIYLIAKDIAEASDGIGPEEEAMLAKIAGRLDVNPKDFVF